MILTRPDFAAAAQQVVTHYETARATSPKAQPQILLIQALNSVPARTHGALFHLADTAMRKNNHLPVGQCVQTAIDELRRFANPEPQTPQLPAASPRTSIPTLHR
ncbi:MAG: hypothetical protein WBK91_09815 [Alphaproteobacteria bacterium]